MTRRSPYASLVLVRSLGLGESKMKIFALAAAAALLACDAPHALSSPPRSADHESPPADGITPPSCTDIPFTAVCVPAECYGRKDQPGTHSLIRHALCPTLNNCRSYVDIVAKTRTCTASGCTNHALGFQRCYEPHGDGGDHDD